MNVNTAIILDKRRPTKDGKYPLKLRITFRRERKLYGVDIRLSEEEWTKIHGVKPRKEYLKIRSEIDNTVREVDAFIEKMEQFSFSLFEREYFKKNVMNDVAAAFDEYVAKLMEEGRVGTASSYRCAKSSLMKFQPGVKFVDISHDFLNRYERWMLKKGNSATSVGIYLRSLRTLVNMAVREGAIDMKQYPFGKGRYQIPKGQNVKKALTIAEVQQIIQYKTVPRSTEDKARDFWLLSYFCNGANMKDICRWRYRNIHGDKLVFYRAKTEYTSRNPKPIVVVLTPQVNEIIRKWGNRKQTSDNYIFPILKPGIEPLEEKKITDRFIHLVNDYMAKIAEELGLNTNLTTYVARHTFSTILKRGGVPIAFISESLGHTDLRTTENYLGSFEDEQKREFAKLLLPPEK